MEIQIHCLKKNSTKIYFKHKCLRLLKSMSIYLYLVLGAPIAWMNCRNVAWHRGHQAVVLLWWSGTPGCFGSWLQIHSVKCLIPSPLDNPRWLLYWFPVRWNCCPVSHSNTIVTDLVLSTFGSVAGTTFC